MDMEIAGMTLNPLNPLKALKEILGLVQKYNDIPLNTRIMELSSTLFEMSEENLALKA